MDSMPTNPNDVISSSINNPGQLSSFFVGVGLTKREYFAAMALQGIISAPVEGDTISSDATDAVAYADALIEALNK